MHKTYTDLLNLSKYEDRVRYLQTHSKIGVDTFGPNRYLNQVLYNCDEWKLARNQAIIRDTFGDNYCYDLAHSDHPIPEGCRIYVHHINPITVEDVIQCNPIVFDLENLVCCLFETHQIIHYSSSIYTEPTMAVRQPNDTSPWRKS